MARSKTFIPVLTAGSILINSTTALANEFFETVEAADGTEYCIGKTSGTFTYRANGAGSASTWSLDNQPWWKGYGTSDGNQKKNWNLGYYLSGQVADKSLLFAYKTGTDQNLRAWKDKVNLGENYFSNLDDSIGATYTLGDMAYSAGLNECTNDDGLIDIDEILKELPSELVARLISRLRGTTRAQRLAALGRFISAGLLPRNVIAAGGLATQAYVNDLADTILERLPSRQFQKLQVEEEITEVEIQDTITEPVRGLWKTSGSAEVDIEIASIEMDGDIYVDDPNLTSIYTEPNGTRAWVRGFGGSMSPYDTGGAYGKRGLVFYDDVYNNFYSTHSGLVVGVDTSLSENVQLGIFGNYGNIKLTQFAGRDTGGGSWNPNGYGGGVMASYWADNFYVQGAFGATAFSGDNKRQVKIGTIVNETYTATKNTTSYMGTVRVGAPFTWGSAILEPQATAIWNGNEDAAYTESGRYRGFALKLNSYSDNFLRTALGAKLAWPIKQGERKLIVPNIKVAWLADWDTNNGAVKFKRAHTRTGRKARTAEIPSNQETQYGVLLEGGVDYAISQGPTTAWKLYAKGGAKLWVNKAADWRTSGGITFQF